MNTFSTENIKKRLLELKAQGMPPSKVATAAEIPQSSMSKFMTGKTSLSARSIEKLWPVIFGG